jgi:threonine/homoserine/homoserine lactone efflux protein
MSLETWLAFLGASALLVMLPGPTILTVISYSIAQGRRARLPLVLAVALGDSTALLLSLLGLGALLGASAFWFTVVKIVGGLYLLYLGFKLLRAGVSPATLPTATASGSRWKLFANTYLVTALNPKGIIFFVAFLPQFIDPVGDVTRQLWILSATFVACAGINATAYAIFAGSARRRPAVRRRDLGLAGAARLACP